ncbi:hypothetical protein KBY58_09785 [Cyanobium sp. HWJ4-Hawea]|uniref:hypothetical protein n=1 Tax=Cyanobium sp. HWJ4-Hawea TaxID=2823713 RepID=UPI0020CF45BC|nr:hypothetical protein [Cyanobium sp. HWJ4-Hawea]MCP9809722.1 hypothetical protein [Cyanobium sp. HWJ4-Hawea]
MKEETLEAIQIGIVSGIATSFVAMFFAMGGSISTSNKFCSSYQKNLGEAQMSLGIWESRLQIKRTAEENYLSKPTPAEIKQSKTIKQTLPELRQIVDEITEVKDERESDLMLCDESVRNGYQDGMINAAMVAGLAVGLCVFVNNKE